MAALIALTQADTVLVWDPTNRTLIAVSGSRISNAIEGGLFGSKRSTNNCLSKNRYASSLPANLRPFSCANARTPNPAKAASERTLALVAKLHRQFLARRAHGQPVPPPQPTMPNP
jgi:hypothetical protein